MWILFQESNPCNPQSMTTWFIDMQTCDEGIVLLMAAHCADISIQIHFALGRPRIDLCPRNKEMHTFVL